jgi:cytochrome b561
MVSLRTRASAAGSKMELIKVVGWVAVGIVVLAWLFVSFRSPSRQRSIVEWIAAASVYLALLCFFLFLFVRARADQQTLGVVAFGFLAAVFGTGTVVSVVKTLREIHGRAPSGPGAAG